MSQELGGGKVWPLLLHNCHYHYVYFPTIHCLGGGGGEKENMFDDPLPTQNHGRNRVLQGVGGAAGGERPPGAQSHGPLPATHHLCQPAAQRAHQPQEEPHEEGMLKLSHWFSFSFLLL